MTYKSIMVSVDIDAPVSSLIKLAMELAQQFDSKLIGCSAADVIISAAFGDGQFIDGELIEQQRQAIDKRLNHLREKFFGLTGTDRGAEWRSDIRNPTDFMIENARAADLIVTGSPEGAKTGSADRAVDIGSLALHAGRPVLVAAAGAEHILAKTAVIGWKDCREARRVIADALPFLRRANEVMVVTVGDKNDRAAVQSLADVVAYLVRQGVAAKSDFVTKSDLLVGEHEPQKLIGLARSLSADLIVAGAYGHSRLREWIFGGVTRSLLDEVKVNRFLSS
jgi:nucleotide-binding universal stress UspA family protein